MDVPMTIGVGPDRHSPIDTTSTRRGAPPRPVRVDARGARAYRGGMAPSVDTLARLLGSAFHRDWEREQASAGACLERALASAGPAELRAAAEEIDALLARGLCEAQVRDVLLYEIGCWYAPERDGTEASTWLARVRARLAGAA
ncbi:MAG TPA: contact-dependent growth inhibition system immunity protein [Longimicrobiales bacterium]|nr:contact-dependent growth inhibition system immunity protein [Longimicrobiales bacterium]